MMRQLTVSATLLALSAAPAAATGPDWLGVLIQNQYLGADLTPLIAGGNDGLLAVLGQIAASDIPARISEQAQDILRLRPDLVGLQEVETFTCSDDPAAPQPPPGEGCSNPLVTPGVQDFLTLLLAELNADGETYRVLATNANFNTTSVTVDLDDGSTLTLPGVPFVLDGFTGFFSAVDRDVILANVDTVSEASAVIFPPEVCRPSEDGCNFQAVIPLPLAVPGGVATIPFERGFAAVDATVRGRDYRFVNTHLEVEFPVVGDPTSSFFQAAQMAELLGIIEATTPPEREVVIVGDINSSPVSAGVPGPLDLPPPFDQGIVPPFQQLLLAGFTDTLPIGAPNQIGFTCCQAADLRNEVSLLDQRIDVIFTESVPAFVRGAQVIGDNETDRTASGLFPSDHGGVSLRVFFD